MGFSNSKKMSKSSKKSKSSKSMKGFKKFETDTIVRHNVDTIEVYTDGSFRKEKEGDVCGYGVYFPNKELKNIAGAFTMDPITNNRAELYAIYRAIRRIEAYLLFRKIIIHTDSEYSLKATTVWIHKWKKNNWRNAKKKPVENQDLIKKIAALLEKHSGKIDIHWVEAHAGIKGNEEADRLANKGADIYRDRYRGYLKVR
jgi:ribonuclease HI